MILLIDNYDSFVFNLARYFERLGQRTLVVRNDAITPSEIAAIEPQAIVLSPGPCTPNEAGCSVPVIHATGRQGADSGHLPGAPGHRGSVRRARSCARAEPMHGRTSRVLHAGQSIFAGLPSPLMACRYHSLIVENDSLPAELEVTAWTADGTIMGLAHRQLPIVGLQFHPESILTDHGYSLLTNFLDLAGVPLSAKPPSI